LLSFPKGLATHGGVDAIEGRKAVEVRDSGHTHGIAEIQDSAGGVRKRGPGRQATAVRVA
jgi:hypothetical protein